jgi:hypothetical protein
MEPRPAPVTIAAIATPPGRGGIGVVRVSGPGERVAAIVEGVAARPLEPRIATCATFRDARGWPIDRGLAILFPAPASYTGETVAEFHGHGSPAAMRLLLARCVELGARLAEPGEFTKRAFLNGKLDLAQAEAVADLLDAASATAARAAARSLAGEFSRAVHAIVEAVTELRMFAEATLDFPEEDLDFVRASDAAARLGRVRAAVVPRHDLDVLVRPAAVGFFNLETRVWEPDVAVLVRQVMFARPGGDLLGRAIGAAVTVAASSVPCLQELLVVAFQLVVEHHAPDVRAACRERGRELPTGAIHLTVVRQFSGPADPGVERLPFTVVGRCPMAFEQIAAGAGERHHVATTPVHADPFRQAGYFQMRAGMSRTRRWRVSLAPGQVVGRHYAKRADGRQRLEVAGAQRVGAVAEADEFARLAERQGHVAAEGPGVRAGVVSAVTPAAASARALYTCAVAAGLRTRVVPVEHARPPIARIHRATYRTLGGGLLFAPACGAPSRRDARAVNSPCKVYRLLGQPARVLRSSCTVFSQR